MNKLIFILPACLILTGISGTIILENYQEQKERTEQLARAQDEYNDAMIEYIKYKNQSPVEKALSEGFTQGEEFAPNCFKYFKTEPMYEEVSEKTIMVNLTRRICT